MKTKHSYTSGPWKVSSDGTWVVGDETGNTGFLQEVATVFNHHERGEANARLIAAAPDLLAALVAILPVFDNDGASVYAKVYADVISAAELAIAKAKG